MSAPTPLETRIQHALVTAIEGITAGTSYHSQMQTVSTDLLLLSTLPASQCPAVILMPDPVASSRSYLMGSIVMDTHAFTIEGRIDADTPQMGERMAAYERLRLDMEYALTRDQSLGGLAVETRLERVGLYPGVGSDPQVHFVDRVLVVSVHALGER